jgi:hypothetical protein
MNLFPFKDKFYSWGGDRGLSPEVERFDLHVFTADGKGGGSWGLPSSTDSTFNDVLATAEGHLAITNTTGYIIGGWASSYTDKRASGQNHIVTPGVVSFDLTADNGKWTNSSPPGLDQRENGAIAYGTAEFLPEYGQRGLIISLGGQAPSRGSSRLNTGDGTSVDFVSLKIYNPVANVWYSQQATGDFPSPRVKACSVTVAGPNKTREVYVSPLPVEMVPKWSILCHDM